MLNKKNTSEQNIKEKPVKEKPVKEKKVKEKPVKEKAVKEKKVKEKPVKEKPVKEKPVKEKPVKERKPKEKPVKEKPVKEKKFGFGKKKEKNGAKESDQVLNPVESGTISQASVGEVNEADLVGGDIVEPAEVAEDKTEVNEEYICVVEEEPPKKKINPLIYVAVAVGLIGVAIGAVLILRTTLLQSQIDLGREYLEAEEYDAATDTFNQALKIFHNSADAYLGLAQASIGRGELTEAVRILEEGIKITGSTNLEKSKENIIDQVFATYVLNEYMINILPGEEQQLEVTHRSEDMGFTVTWASDDESVGTVDETGLVTAVRNGKATITATIGNEVWGYRDVTASLIVGVIVTYLEEKGCDYVDNASALTAPCFVYQLDKDGYRIYDGTLEIEQGNATYSLTKCKASDPDVNGNVTYSIEYTVTVPTKFGILADSKEAKNPWYYNWVVSDMMLCDDYTGRIFSVQDLYGSEDLVYDSTVNWNGVDYPVTGKIEQEWINEEDWAVTYSPLTLTTWAEAPVIGKYSITVTVPKEYEGLVLALDKNGTTDYTDPVYDEEEDEDYDAAETFTDTFFFDPLEDGTVRKPEDFYIIRIRDFLENKETE